MLKYIARRFLYMIPTIFGVIIITFILFNVSGGSPALMKLGKQAVPKTLEDFDVQRGYDKPLFFGLWGTTRAFSGHDFGDGPGVWRNVPGVIYTNRPECKIVLSGNAEYEIPLAFSLNGKKHYQWELDYRLRGGGKAVLVAGDPERELTGIILDSSDWGRRTIEFTTDENTADFKCRIIVDNGASATAGKLEVRSIQLKKRAGHLLDSQLCLFLRQISRFDFGSSLETNQKISTMIKEGVLPSLALTVPMFIIEVIAAIALALICAFFRDTFMDHFFVIISVVLMSVNYLVWIIAGQQILGYSFRWFPVWGFESWRYLVLPCLIGIVSGLGASLRFYRTVMLDEMYKDYVRTAFAKGVSRSGVLFKHVLKNAMIPILTSVVIALPFLVTGSLLLETFFGIPGLGNLAINAINNSDFDVIRAEVFIVAMIYVVANLATDICYALFDPRVRLK